MKKALVILPTYNEAENIESLIKAIFEETKKLSNWRVEILVVDSRSPDRTGQKVKKLQSQYPQRLHLLEIQKEGLGQAYYNGFFYALNSIKPYILLEMDADWSHDPKDIPRFLKAIETGADFAIGSRYIKGGSIPKDWAVHRKIFSVFGNFIVRLGFMQIGITDWTSGFRAMKTWIVKDIAPYLRKYTGYVFQIALLDKAIKKGAYIHEIPIHFKNRKRGLSKINSFQYIWQTLVYIIVNSSFIRFIIVGGLGFLIDFTISYFLIEMVKIKTNLYWLATTFSGEIAIINNFILNNFWSFSHKKIKPQPSSLFYNFIKFNLISSGSIIIQAIGIQLLTNLFGNQLWFVYKTLIILFIIIPYSYILYNKIIWKRNQG